MEINYIDDADKEWTTIKNKLLKDISYMSNKEIIEFFNTIDKKNTTD